MKIKSFLTKLVSLPDFYFLLVVLISSFLASRTLFTPGYFNMHDDLQMMRQLQMEKCFLDLQIPCRWVPDMGYGFGYPLFNFYPPLPYLTGQLFRLVGFSFVDTAKLLFALSFFVSSVTMYFLSKNFFGRVGGVLSAIFYTWAPYHAVDVYVRGAMNESWALMWFPLIFLAGYKLITNKKVSAFWIITLALSWFSLFTSHNLMVIVFTPFFAVWCLVWLVVTRGWSRIIPLVAAGALSFSLAAFFTLPVFLEKDIVQTGTLIQGYYEYTAHFASINQLLISRFWDYGPSVWLEEDRMSFQVGWLVWIAPLVLGAFLTPRLLKKPKSEILKHWVLAFGLSAAFGFFALFLTHSRSINIWQLLSPLHFIQFPWRYLTVVIFGLSLSVGVLLRIFNKKFAYPVATFLALGAIIYSWNYFLPEKGKMLPLEDLDKFTGVAWDMQRTAGIYDYLPNTAEMAPQGARTTQVDVIEGKAEHLFVGSGTNWEKFKLNVEEESIIRLNVLQFPVWRVFANGQEVETYVDENEKWGRIYFKLGPGSYEIEARLYNTPARTIGNIISIVSWTGLAGYLVITYKKSKQGKKKK